MNFIFLIILYTTLASQEGEIENKYQVEISNIPVVAKESYSQNTVLIDGFKNKTYICYLPSLKSETSIEEPSINLISPLELLKPYWGECLHYFTSGYWEFEICIGKNITQLHKDSDGVIRGDNYFIIGRFESEKIWTDEEMRDLKAKNLYHSQMYLNGSPCDHKTLRSTELRFVCGFFEEPTIISYFEEVSCRYFFYIEFASLCKIPALRVPLKSFTHTITCKPLVTDSEYDEYLKLQEKNKEEATITINDFLKIHLDESQDFIDGVLQKKNMKGVYIKMFKYFEEDKNPIPRKEHTTRNHDDAQLKNVDVKAIIEKEYDQPVLKWRLSYNQNVDFYKILEKSEHIRSISSPQNDKEIKHIRITNTMESDPDTGSSSEDIELKERVTYYMENEP